MDDTVLLVTAVAAKSAREGQDFFPLTVDYQEKFYAGSASRVVSSSVKAVRPRRKR